MAKEAISNGEALKTFAKIIKAQGGSTKIFNGLSIKPKVIVKSEKSGVLTKIDVEGLGNIVGKMGGTKQKLNDEIDYNAGVKTFHKLNDKVSKGKVIFEVYAKTKKIAEDAAKNLLKCYTIE